MARYVVGSLLNTKNWKVWASLSAELPLLAEAAPDAFLTALETDLKESLPVVVSLFDPEALALFGRDAHTGLLFALEVLAWEREWLPRVSYALARLCDILPTTNAANTPMRTLEQNFTPWCPQTTAPIQDRIRILEQISRRHPKAAWDLLLDLLQTQRTTATTNCRPAFRNWTLGGAIGVTPMEAAAQEEAGERLVVALAGQDPHKLGELIKRFEYLTSPWQVKLLENLQSLLTAGLEPEHRRSLAETLREKTHQLGAYWYLDRPSMPGTLAELARIQKQLEPEPAAMRHAWLFRNSLTVWMQIAEEAMPGEEGGCSPDALQQIVGSRRVKAVTAVRAEQGWEGIMNLAAIAANPDLVGRAVAACAVEGDDDQILPGSLRHERKGLPEFVQGYVEERRVQQGEKWIAKLSHGLWSDDQLLGFALALPPKPEAWDLVASRSAKVEEHYWKQVTQFSTSADPADIARACRMLTKVGRPLHAMRQLKWALLIRAEVDPSVLIEALDQGAKEQSQFKDQQAIGELASTVPELVQRLQQAWEAGDSRVDLDTLRRIELTYLSFLDGHPVSPRMLHRWMEDDPACFVQLLAALYADGIEDGGNNKDHSEKSHACSWRARRRLFRTWRGIPGLQADKSINEATLRQWICTTRDLAQERGLQQVADSRIGQLFAFAPKEADGTWPCITIRDLFEDFWTKDLAEGFVVGIMNRRDELLEAMGGGGNREQALAKLYLDWSEALGIEWPQTSVSLHNVGEWYKAEASRAERL